ncbi:uncharacterized protein LOC124832066 [Vigna umbellata]|uniref:uncharacterized protein LOC124832066 n=1 Tax=Vigna umbellata TaxID=87088 RepID=UPI001F5F5565|nr:uncharacterized protein LOC124832066 [Vigna umbellata]
MEDDIEVVSHHGGKLVNEGCLEYERESDTMYFDPDLWSYFVVVSVVKGLGYDGFKDLWFSVGCGPILDDKLEPLCDDVGTMYMVNLARLNGQVHLYVVHTVSEPEVIDMIEYNVDEGVLDERTEEDDGGVTSQFGEATYDGVDGHGERIEVDVGEDDVGEGERIQVHVGEVDRMEVHVGEGDRIQIDVGEGDRIQIDVGEGERIEVDEGHDVEGKRIEDDESHDDKTQANDVEETIEVHETHHQMEVDEAHDERTVVNDGEGNRTEVEELEDIEVEVREWSTSDDNGEVNSMDGLVDINIQCDLRESDNYGNVEVSGSGLPKSDLEEDDISDTSLFNDEWEYEELTSPDISVEEIGLHKSYLKSDMCLKVGITMRFLNLDGEDYIPVCFLTSTYEEMYSSIIYPINGNNLWEVTEYPNVMPPSSRKLHGRPKKKMRLEQWELKKNSTSMSKGGLVKRCSKCREVGHNRTSCPKTNQEPVVQAQREEPTSLAEAEAHGEQPHGEEPHQS